jgi:hypothetical protein
VIETDRNEQRHITEPGGGIAAWARGDVVSWGLFGVLFGAMAGATAGRFHGAVAQEVAMGIAWALFGALAVQGAVLEAGSRDA